MEHLSLESLQDGSATLMDGSGHTLEHAAPDGMGVVFTNEAGEVLGYDHPFMGVDNFLDSHLQHIMSLDSFGTLHDAAGEATGHIAFWNGTVEVTDMHNQLIADVSRRFGV